MGPDLAARFDGLEAARRRALALLEPHDRVALNRRPAPGRWSALQVLHHVVASETATLAYIRKKMQGGTALPPVGLASRLRRLVLHAALVLPLRFQAPAATAAVPDEIDAAELRARWEDVRRGWRDLLDGFPPALEHRLVFRHPFVGLMGLADTLAFLHAHLEHHLRQVEGRPPFRSGAGRVGS
jgi:uncharacterized damage-inducible protein DinB